MTPYDPRSSSRTRHLAFAGVLATGVLAAILAGSLAVAIVVFVGAGLLDFLAFLALPVPGRALASVSLEVVPAGKGSVLVAGGRARLLVRLGIAGLRQPTRFVVVPLEPRGVEAEGPPGVRCLLSPGDEVEAAFPFRLRHSGVLVFPGVLLRRSSPLGFFGGDRFLPARREARVLPDFSQTDDPLLARYLRLGESPAHRTRSRMVKGEGSDFAEIREYRAGDPERRMDWKATARRRRLLVREYEEPQEYTIRILLDGSLDLVSSEGFAGAADLVAKLGWIATTQSISVALSVYDRTVLFERRLSGRRMEFTRLMAEIVALPRNALLRAAVGDDLPARAEELFRKTVGRWSRGEPDRTLAAFLDEYQEDAGPDPASFLADFDPGGLEVKDETCPECGAPRFPDEPSCVACADRPAPESLPPRASCLAALIARSLRDSRGREMLVLVSALRGGEACDRVADLLALASTPHRRVHLVLPTYRELADDRVEFPRELGAYPELERTFRNAEKMLFAERLRGLVGSLRTAGVGIHALEAPSERDSIVSTLLRSGVL